MAVRMTPSGTAHHGVLTKIVNGVAVLTIDNRPVNTLTLPVRSALIEELNRAESSPDILGVVLRGVGGRFSAGADLAEFDSGRGLAEPSLHATILRFLDNMSIPVVAAIDGLALGGGLELAMGCHFRVVSRKALLGLPESTFGFLPGAGGTQRLPRAIGVEKAVNLMLSGRAVPAADLEGTGLISLLVDGDTLEPAIGFAREAAGRPLLRLRDRPLAHGHLEPFLAFVERTTASAKEAPVGARAIVDALRAGAEAFDRGIATEERHFRELAARPPARSARYRFFAERSAGRLPAAARDLGSSVERVAIVGAGTMGLGISLAFAARGIPVDLVDIDADALARSAAYLEKERTRRPGRYPAEVVVTTDWMVLRAADLVVESVFEDLAVKRDVFRRLDEVARPGAVLATNTSSLDVDRIADVVSRPEAVVGMHFFSPAQVMRLVEVVQAEKTDPAVLATAVLTARRLGKLAVIVRIGDGFIGNRMIDQYIRQAMQLVREGVPPHRVDEALERWGFRMGPFRMLDVIGNDVPALARAARGDAGPDWAIADELVRRGWLGRKSGIGWYRYDERGRPTVSSELEALLKDLAASAVAADDDIAERCVLSLVNEGAHVLEDRVAARASDIDVVMGTGYGFPLERGGPMFTADELGLRNVVRRMRDLRARVPSMRDFWEPRPLLVDLAERDGSLADWSPENA